MPGWTPRASVISARRPVGTPLELARSNRQEIHSDPRLFHHSPQTSELHPTESVDEFASTARPIYSSTSRSSFCRAATVAGVSEDEQGDMALAAVQEELARDGLYFSHATDDLEGCYGRLDSASVAAYGDLDNQRWANEEEKYVHSPSKSPTTCHSPPLHQAHASGLLQGARRYRVLGRVRRRHRRDVEQPPTTQPT
ncbi:hypothetical protein PSTT_11250 [Puccinia striiformis]|uniref:Uncharacterized protein n=1 Tax=Puccinia striiformis TaxID=27350 RepID=A0A2S4V0T1_9BASI|nr:hypothetical protein PSTT_11250 [Puccinia striiformis]